MLDFAFTEEQHNEYVYTKLLGLSDPEWAKLMAEGVI